MLRQLQKTRHLTTLLCLLTLLVAAAGLILRGRKAQAQPTLFLGNLAGKARSEAPRLAPLGSPKYASLPRPPDPWKSELDWNKVIADEGGFVQVLHDGGRVELTLDPRLQRMAEHVLDTHRTSYAGAVLLSVEDGRVLAMTGRSSAEPDKSAAELTLQPWAPAASIFKLVTASALVDAGVAADTRVCYHDGIHSVEASNLTPHKRWDQSCASLSYGVAKSQNAIVARLAHDHLDADSLRSAARALGFGERLPFELPVGASQAQVPRSGSLQFARVAAGFWSTTLSPLHGAYLAATLARGGVTPAMRIVDRVVDSDGSVKRPEPPAVRRAISEEAARAVARMMVGTTEYGTAKSGFHKNGRALLPGVAVAGKTGSLDRQKPYLAYSWFVGFAPAEKPEVAVAVLLGNGEDWHWRAHQVAAELLAGYFTGLRRRRRSSLRADMRWRNEPLVHFAVLGLCLFGLYKLVAPRPRERIVLSKEFVNALREEARARSGRLPTAAEEAALVDRFVDEEMLYREALSLGLDRGDLIVRRRLVQKMELLSRRSPERPSDAELRRFLDEHRDRYDLPERLTIRQVFAGEQATAPITRALDGGGDWEKLGLPFLAGRRFVGRSQKELAAIFGEAAAAQAMTLRPGVWSPLRSRYGAHLFYVEERLAAQPAQVDARVEKDWLEARRAQPDPGALAALRAHYTVERP